jgi:acyl carrier protein
LVGYLVTHQETTLSVNELRNFLKEKLPEYMIPSTFVVLDALPLLPNGKVDHRALRVPENLRPDLTAVFQPPQSDIEKTIVQVWQKVLHLEKVGIHDNFFDLGGHSLLATQIVSQLRQDLHLELSLRCIFEAPTIAELALVIEDMLIGELEELPESEAEKRISTFQD